MTRAETESDDEDLNNCVLGIISSRQWEICVVVVVDTSTGYWRMRSLARAEKQSHHQGVKRARRTWLRT